MPLTLLFQQRDTGSIAFIRVYCISTQIVHKMIKQILLTLVAVFTLVSCGTSSSETTDNTTDATSQSATPPIDTEKLKADLKSRICDFLTDDEVQAIFGVTLEGHVSGYDGTTAQYCSYNWNNFNQEVRFAYVFSTVGDAGKVAESLRMFNDSDLEKVMVGFDHDGAFWNTNTSRLVVFISDVQLFVDLRKYDGEDAKAKATALVERALEGY